MMTKNFSGGVKVKFFLFIVCLSRSVYKRSTNNEELRDISEEGFLFLTDRSDFWRNQKPIYATKGEKEKIIKSRKKKIHTDVSVKKGISID